MIDLLVLGFHAVPLLM